MSDSAMAGGLLLVEDNDADVMFFKRALLRAKPEVPLRVAVNGIQAVEILSEAGPSLPSLVILDLKLPRLSGLEVLQWMRAQSALRTLRTGVLTSSAEECDIRRAHALQASFYVVKPVEFAVLQTVVASIAAYWEEPTGPALAAIGRHCVPLPAKA